MVWKDVHKSSVVILQEIDAEEKLNNTRESKLMQDQKYNLR